MQEKAQQISWDTPTNTMKIPLVQLCCAGFSLVGPAGGFCYCLSCRQAGKIRDYKIMYEDDTLLVVEKPSGMLTVATPKKEQHTLSALVKAYPAHRLDRETSGLIIFAKTKEIQQILMDEFRKRKVTKRYLAFAQGKVMPKTGIIDRKVRDNSYAPEKPALTKYKVVKYRNGFSVVEVMPVTGRTNQIRIHFKQIGHPLVGERRFAFAKDFAIKFRRVALHASDLEFSHPLSGRIVSFHSDLPPDMQDFLNSH